MRLHLATVVTLAAIAAMACSEQPEPAAAVVKLQAVQTTSSCSFSSMSPLVAHYFNGSADKQTVGGLLNDMKSAYNDQDVETTRNRGFDVMSYIATQVKAGNTDVQDASSLTNALLACMFFTAGELPQGGLPADFTIATDPSKDGAYEVRGGDLDPSSDPDQRVYSRPIVFNSDGSVLKPGFSGIAPKVSALSWSDIIQTQSAPNRVLLYGQPGSNSQSYDWSAVPRNVHYIAPEGGPGALVGFCSAGSRIMVHESGESFVGFNPFADAYFMDPPMCQDYAFDHSSWNPLRLVGRLFSVRAAWANPGGSGGLVGGHSEFDADLTQMTDTFTTPPPATVQVCSDPDAGCPAEALFSVAVTTYASGTSADGTVHTGKVGPATLYLTAFNNNGTSGELCQLTPEGPVPYVCTTLGDATGNQVVASSGGSPDFDPAVFDNLFFTKTGGVKLVATGTVDGRPNISGQVTSDKINVKP